MNNENNPSSEKKKKLKVAFYIRISTEDQKEMYGEALQLASLEGLLKSREYGLEFAGKEYIYKDLGVSGSLEIKDRPGMNRLFNDLKYGKPFDIVAIYKIDRLARSLKILLNVVEEFEDNGIDFISSLESIDTSSPFGKAMLGILGVFAELEKDMNQKKMSEGLIAGIKQGNKISDTYGYDRYAVGKMKHYKKNIEEEKIIKNIFEDYVSAQHKGDIGYIRNKLTEKKVYVPSVAEKIKNNKSITNVKHLYRWHNQAIKRILKDETYIGIYYYGKTESPIDKKTKKRVTINLPKDKWVKANIKHIPLINDKLFYKAQKILESDINVSHQNKHTKNGNIYIFSGLLKCDSCKSHRINGGMYSWIGDPGKKSIQYICKGRHRDSNRVCNVIPINSSDLDRIIIGEIKHIIKNPIAIKKYVANKKLIDEGKKYLEKELEEITIQIDRYILGQKNIYKRLKFGDTTDAEYQNDYDELEKLINIEKQKSEEINIKLQGQFELEDYSHSFKLLNDILINDIDDILNDKLKAQKLMNYLIDEVIIYSEDNNGRYSLSGPKKECRQVPYKVEVKLKLPQVFLDDLLTLNNINNDDIIGDHLWKKVEEKEKEIEKDKNKKGKGGGKGGGGGTSSTYNKAANTLKNIKENLINNIIRLKNQTSPFLKI